MLAQFEQFAGIVVDELGMPLEAQHLVADGVGGIGTEVAGSDHPRVFRQPGDLVLVADQQGQVRQRRAHPVGPFVQLVLVDAHAPALAGALGLATEQQGQQLVAETHAEELVAALVAVQEEGLQGLDPRVGTEGVGLAAGHQVGVEALVVRRIAPLHHVVDDEFGGDRLLGEQLLEHPAVAFVALDQLGTKDIGFQDTDAERHKDSLKKWGYCRFRLI